MIRIIRPFVAFGLCLGLVSCHHHPQEDSHHDDHGHSHEYPSMNLTSQTDDTELFVDFPVLAVGKQTSFAAHFTRLSTYKPYKQGSCKLELIKDGVVKQEAEVDSPKSDGLFLPVISPEEAGKYFLLFYFNSNGVSDTIGFQNVKVYSSEDDAIHNHSNEAEGDEVAFSKEQAWKIQFATDRVETKTIQKVIRTSGEILPMESDEKLVTASSDGLVIFKSNNLVEGQNISEGTSLFVINNDKLISSNLSEKYAVLKANLESSKKNLERSLELLEKNIISQKEYENRERQYAVDLASYETLNKNYSSGGMTLTAPASGILKKLYVTNGQFVKEGQSLATISRNKQLLIEAEVSQKYFKEVPNIQSANIKLPWNDEVVSIQNYNGKIVSTGSSTKRHYIPVVFRIDNKGDIMPGTFLEIYLKTSESNNALVIPHTALLKEYDSYFVYVMVAGEKYEKRNVIIGIDDGENVEVISGLKENEVIVSQGAYAIKMASMSSSIPAHGHAH